MYGSHVVVGIKGHYDQYGSQVELATGVNDQHAELPRHIAWVEHVCMVRATENQLVYLPG